MGNYWKGRDRSAISKQRRRDNTIQTSFSKRFCYFLYLGCKGNSAPLQSTLWTINAYKIVNWTLVTFYMGTTIELFALISDVSPRMSPKPMYRAMKDRTKVNILSVLTKPGFILKLLWNYFEHFKKVLEAVTPEIKKMQNQFLHRCMRSYY